MTETTPSRDTPVAGFRAETSAAPFTLLPARQVARDAFGYALEDKVLEDTPLRAVDWAYLHAYMTRRFGPPHLGTPGKVLSGAWMLTTPDPDTFVEVRPTVGAPGFSFVPLMRGEEDAMGVRLPAERQAMAAAAYRATLIDLLRPVRTDDPAINALGEADLYDPALGADEEGYNPLRVESHPSTGYATPLGVNDGKTWQELWGLIALIGDGDAIAGRDALLDILYERTVADLARESLPVRLLVAGHVRGPRGKSTLDGLGLTEAERAEAGAIASALSAAWQGREIEPMRDLDDGDVDRAVALLGRLTMYAAIPDALGRYRAQVASKAFAEAFHALGDYPEEALPSSILPNRIEVAGLPERLRALGREAQARLAAEAIATDDGIVHDLMQRAFYDAGQAKTAPGP